MLDYLSKMSGKPLNINITMSPCDKCDGRKTSPILCLFWDRKPCIHSIRHVHILNKYLDYETINLLMCKCTPFTARLIQQGFFPTAPSQPNLTISILFLEFYRALFEHTGDMITTVAATLSSFYDRWGYPVVDKKVSFNNSDQCFMYLHWPGGAYCRSILQIIQLSSSVVQLSVQGDLPMCWGHHWTCVHRCSPRSTFSTCLSTYHHWGTQDNNKSGTQLVKAIHHSCCSTTPEKMSCMLWGSNDWPVIQGVSFLAKIYQLANIDLHCKAEEMHMSQLTAIFIRGIWKKQEMGRTSINQNTSCQRKRLMQQEKK